MNNFITAMANFSYSTPEYGLLAWTSIAKGIRIAMRGGQSNIPVSFINSSGSFTLNQEVILYVIVKSFLKYSCAVFLILIQHRVH